MTGVWGDRRIRHVCSKCGGSGTNPPGNPMYSTPLWVGETSKFIGWGYTTDNTAPIPTCDHCRGTGMEPDAIPTPETKGE